MANAIEQIYDKLAEVFGGTNPNQVFCMMMPGTSLDAKQYAYDTTAEKPATVQEAESKLADQLFDIAKVTGGPNGQRLSTQYLQALSVLVPNFNPVVPPLKKTLRDYLNTPVPAGTLVDGQPFAGTLQQYYFKLFDGWIQAKQAWEKTILDKKQELAKDPATEKEKYLEWYEQVAEGELAKIDEAMARVLVVLAPADMEAMLGALAAGPGGELDEAVNATKDIRLASPNGGYFYPVDLVPQDWFLELASDQDPVNLLQDPEFIAASISARRQALLASISQIQGMISQMPTQGEIKTAAAALQSAQQSYVDAQNALLNTYADNTATAVEMYLAKYPGGSGAADPKGELDTSANAVSAAKGTKTTAGAQKRAGGGLAAITPEDVQKLVDGQKKLVKAQSDLQTSSQALAAAGLTLGAEQAAYLGDLPILLSRLQAQLADVQSAQDQLATSIATLPRRTLPDLGAPPDALRTTAAKAVSDAKAAADLTGAVNAVNAACGDAAGLARLRQAAQDAQGQQGATKDTLVAAITPVADAVGAPAAAKSGVSQRFMDLQFSFSASDMSKTSSADSSFSQTSWSVDLFFGSASGSSSTSKASSSQHAFDSSTEIKIGLKAAKIDIERGWFNPGLFKLSGEMSRLSRKPVSNGAMRLKTTGSDVTPDWSPGTIGALNDALLPAFPVAFIVVKDVNITFKVSESSLDAVKSVLDSRSAAGGGFLCFSVSGSSASHSESSSLQTRSRGTVINIAMPGPQILGWFLETTPEDRSAIFKWDPAADAKPLPASVQATDAEISIIEFTRRVAAAREGGIRAPGNTALAARTTTAAQGDRNGQAPQADGNGHAPQLHA